MSAKCGWCNTKDDLWLINPQGGYGGDELSACTKCLKGEAAGCVPRLLESYPTASANELRKALACA